jgi:hypothetical protein
MSNWSGYARHEQGRVCRRVRREMGCECDFDAVITVVPGDELEVLRRSVPPTDRSFMHMRTDIMLELAAVVLIDTLWQVADPHFQGLVVLVCAVVR